MQIDALLSKLEPLIPERVARWRNVRPLIDSTTRDLLDKEIHETARRVLGDYRHKLLLSLPPEKTARGEFDLGAVHYERKRWHAGLRRSELMQNVAVLGRSGSGKTNVVFHLLRQLTLKGLPVLFFDVKRTARHLLGTLRPKPAIFTPGRDIAPFAFNPFKPPPGDEPHGYTVQLVDTLGSAFQLGEGAKSVLLRVILNAYAESPSPTASTLLKQLESLDTKGRASGWHASALRALQVLDVGPLTETSKQAEQIASLTKRSTIVELDGLSETTRSFLVPMLLLWVYRVQLATRKREQLQLIVVLEEAHHYLYRNERRTTESVISRLLRQFREVGVGTIIVDQHAHLLATAALGNAYATICLNQKDPSDINKAAALSLLGEDEKPWLSRLPVGQSIVKLQDRWHQPFLVQFPLVNVDKGSVSDDDLRAYVQSNARSAPNLTPEVKSRHVQHGRVGDRRFNRRLSHQELTFLSDVLAHPHDGVKARFARLGISVDAGTRCYRKLIQNGILESAIIKCHTTRRVVLRLTQTGHKLLGLTTKHPQESLAHAHLKHYYTEHYRSRGYRVTVEAERVGGRVDILAEHDDERVGIEIESGNSDAVRNVKNGLRSGFTRIEVVATSQDALQQVERNLGKAGLLIPGRVAVRV